MTDFADRHIGPTEAEQQYMLGSLGYSSLDELTTAALPDGTPPADLHLPDPLTETGALAELRRMAGRNQLLTPMIGMGYYLETGCHDSERGHDFKTHKPGVITVPCTSSPLNLKQ